MPTINLVAKKEQLHLVPGTLKEAMTSSPILALADFTKPFIMLTDASGIAIGAVLMQEGHPIAFLSKVLSTRNSLLSAYKRRVIGSNICCL